MIYFLLFLLILLYVAGSLRALPSPVTRRRGRLLRLLAVLIAAGAGVVLFYRDGSYLTLKAIPWIEPGIISLDERGAVLGSLAIMGYALFLWIEAQKPADAWWQALAPPVLLTAAFGALNVNHFVYRYVFLEVAALATLVLVVHWNNWRDLASSFLMLRLGDLALLGTIVLLWQAHGTLLISPLLEAAAIAADGTTLLAVLLGLVAVWIKLGLYPFNGWLKAVSNSAGPESWAGLAGGMPLLGAYLLYRLESNVHALGIESWLIGLGVVMFLLALFPVLRTRGAEQRHHLQVAHGALALVAIPLGLQYLYLYSFLPVRFLLVPSPLIWGRGEVRREFVVAPKSRVLWQAPVALALAIELRLLEGFNHTVARLAGHASYAARVVDQNVLETGFLALERFALTAGRRLRRLHTGRLRVNLAWMGALAALTVVLVAVASLI